MVVQDVDFLGAFEDTFQGEDSAEMRFKPLGKWFEAKEQVIQRLTGTCHEDLPFANWPFIACTKVLYLS